MFYTHKPFAFQIIFFEWIVSGKKMYLCSPKKEVLLFNADVMKLVDMPDLGSGASRRVGSSPPIRTNLKWYKN